MITPERPDSLEIGDDFRAIPATPEEFAENYANDELEWLHYATGRALGIKAREDRERAHWEARTQELITQFNGGPINPGAGQIPTMGLRAVEYIIAQEKDREDLPEQPEPVGESWIEYRAVYRRPASILDTIADRGRGYVEAVTDPHRSKDSAKNDVNRNATESHAYVTGIQRRDVAASAWEPEQP